jgi:hypothetical protein
MWRAQSERILLVAHRKPCGIEPPVDLLFERGIAVLQSVRSPYKLHINWRGSRKDVEVPQ